jgi:hypothetical protein
MWWKKKMMMNKSIGDDCRILHHFDSNVMKETIYFFPSDDTENDNDDVETTDKNPVAEPDMLWCTSFRYCCYCCGTLIMLEMVVIFAVFFVVISSVHIEFSLNDNVVIVVVVDGRAYSSTHMDSTVFEWNEFVWLQQQQQQQLTHS